MRIRPITSEEARTVRLPVLRAGLPPESAILPHDDDAETRHVGAFDGERLIGVATFFPEPCPGRPSVSAWRLRGMATIHDRQRSGAGRALIAEGIRIARDGGAVLLWCNARVSARGFYEKVGFVTEGPQFDLSVAGPHYVMIKDLRRST
jgi:GNAT superfamily N-acetyltransferase